MKKIDKMGIAKVIKETLLIAERGGNNIHVSFVKLIQLKTLG